MVVVNTIGFPFSKTNMNVLIGTVDVPYKSQNTAGYKTISIGCPVGVKLDFTNFSSQAQTITVSSEGQPNIQIYKNSVFFGTVPNGDYTGSATSKSFLMSSSSAQVTFNFNSYYYNVSTGYTLPVNTNVGTIDIYTFYAQINYTVSSTSATLKFIGTAPITFIININTNLSTSSFSNFSYASGSSDTSGYVSYSFQQIANYATAWDGSQAPSYQPTITTPNLWTGLYQLAVLYANNIFVGNSINFKNMGSSNVLGWFDTDANGSGYITNVYASNYSGAFKIDMEASKCPNGMIVSGGSFNVNDGNLNVPSQQKTWYITGSGANGTTTAGNRIGASTNGGTGRFNIVNLLGGASITEYSTSTATFTASVSGTYFFQLNVFNNGTNTIGRNIRFVTSSFMGNQYCFFNEQATTSECSFNWTALIYLSGGDTAYFDNQSGGTLTLFYASGHTNLTITKLF